MTDELKIPEAGGVAFMTLYSRTGVPINVTARAATSFDALTDLLHTATRAMAEWDMTTEKPMPPAASAPAVPLPVKIAQEAGNVKQAQEAAAQFAEVPPAPNGSNWLTYDAVVVKVLPQPDDKVTIEFYGNDKKSPHNDYPGIKVNKWSTAQAAGLMKYVTSEDISKAASYQLHCRVYYIEGKEYTTTSGATGHYKNVFHVRPL